ncbi:MAG: hypothetical protein Q7J57_09480, partial [Gemmobacter sp.]|nr:hypothetical protein [Gemmobacter sp.]
MSSTEQLAKRVIVHVGPHKTGSTAIQQCLASNQSPLNEAGISYLDGKRIHDAAMLLVKGAFDEAENLLKAVSQQISDTKAPTVILSQEDFCGDLPGRSRRRAIYPKLTKNLRIIARSLKPHEITFVFFLRDSDEWIKSCYHQHLKYRTLYSNLTTFEEHFGGPPIWEAILEKPKEAFGQNLVVLPYSKVPDAGVRALL